MNFKRLRLVKMNSLLLWICIIATLGLEVRGSKIKRQQTTSSVCSGKDGVLVAMPGSCSGFFFCIDGNAIASSCGNFYQFNSLLGICDHPWNVFCNGQSSTTSPAITEVSSDSEAIFVCDRSAPEGHIFGKSLSCTQFYVCRQKVAVRRICPPQRHFNLEAKVCQDVGQAECVYSNDSETSTIPAVVVAPSTTGGIRKPGNMKKPLHDSGLQVNFSPSSVCSSGKENTAVAHPWDCGKFVYCLKERPLVLTCPKYLHFNSLRQRCEWPSSVQCLI